ncbi:MAG: sigma 54-interacting transcriptional regulator [Planctomycetia bacterium]|nr:sigma 54-interacting transcriptional regulator [Planctomycetia bacterium]
MLAYLVIRDGPKWSDVFRLVPDEGRVRIGRAPTNQIVVKDDRSSRSHAEVFFSGGQWILRDLGSRNGTAVGAKLIEEDHLLQPGDVIRIGRSQMVFVHDLAKAYPDSSSLAPAARAGAGQASDDTVTGDASAIVSAPAPPADDAPSPTITHRRGHTRFLERPEKKEESGSPKEGRAAANLCRLAFELANCNHLETLCHLALQGVFEGTRVDAGAVLLFPRDFNEETEADELQVVASRSDTAAKYHRISPMLASTVLREGEAVLARNISGDSVLGSPNSRGEFDTTSVICAPIRHTGKVLGLIHLYSTQPDVVFDPEDLEFTLAVAETVGVALENLSEREKLAEDLNKIATQNVQLRAQLGAESEIVGKSHVIRKITEQIARAAPSKATILIRGESGVGKELVARAIHFSSPRAKNAFLCLNCAALTESLLESELFGHERGAFTGATDRKIGKFEAADKGTLMLDEIGEMSPHLQAKFLRVLEGHPFERVGGSEPITVDVRVIAATNRDLEKEVETGNFRRDLYFRLRVVEIVVAGLRKRPEDIPVLSQYFLDKYNAETGRKIRGFTPQALDQILRYRWPGNVRELKNVIERAVVLCEGDSIDAADLMLSKLPTAGETGKLVASGNEFSPMSLADLERQHILATLVATGWNKSQTAALLGIERSTLDRKIRRYDIQRDVPA